MEKGGCTMKKLFFGTMLLALVLVFPVSSMARVDVGINIGLPAPFLFAAPPAMVMLPGTNVYVVPDSDVDVFFYQGWWWRPWEGRWYRSHDYNSGWEHYGRVPSFYSRIPSGWRNDYREHRWQGRPWNARPIPHSRVLHNLGTRGSKNMRGGQGMRGRNQSRPQQSRSPQGKAKRGTNGKRGGGR
jgi:hypothetical protein